MSEVYYHSELSCGHELIGKKKVVVGQQLRCSEHGIIFVKEVEKGTVEAYRGFVPKKE